MQSKSISSKKFRQGLSCFFIFIIIIFFIIMKFNLSRLETNNYNIKISKNILLSFTFFVLLSCSFIAVILYSVRCEIINFTNSISEVIDDMIAKKEDIKFDLESENILSKLESKLKSFYDIVKSDKEKAIDERNNVRILIADISHQIKTPIANIIMYTDMIIDGDFDSSMQKKFLKNMKLQTAKLDWLVSSLVKMSRFENNIISFNNRKCKLSNIFSDVIGSLYFKAMQKNIDIICEIDENLYFDIDKKWMAEAIFNIIENAIKYTNSGGEIKISIQKFELFTRVDIQDNGIGIKSESINNIFKRFYREKEVYDIEGVGVGLYLANEIITKQGGYIKVESKIGCGSIFSIYLKN